MTITVAEPFRGTVVEILYALMMTFPVWLRQHALNVWLDDHPDEPQRELLEKLVAMKDPRVLEMRVADAKRVTSGDKFYIIDASKLSKQPFWNGENSYAIRRGTEYEILQFIVP